MSILEGLLVVEYAEGVAGPLAALRLADLGASVVKLESDEGDWMRGAAPAMLDSEVAAAFFALNRGKRSLALGARPAAAAPLLQALLSRADVFITDRGEAELEALGLGAFLADPPANPRLVVADISPWGRKGPLAEAPGSELAVEAMAGYTRYLGTAQDPPRRLGADAAGAAAGVFALQAVLAALLWRRNSGRGQRVSLSLLGALLSLKSIQLAAQSDPDVYAGPRIAGPHLPPERGWQAADRPFFFMFGGSVGASGRPGWQRFVEEMGMSRLEADPRFDKTGRDSTGHGVNVPELRGEYEREFSAHSAQSLVAAIRRHGGSAAIYFSAEETLAHPQTKALGIVREIPFGSGGKTGVCRFPARFSESRTRVRERAPRLGEDGEAIAAELGFGSRGFAELCRCGALFDPSMPTAATRKGREERDGQSS